MPKVNKPRVVIDTNLIISAAIFTEGSPRKLLQAWKDKLFDLSISDDVLDEIVCVSQREHLVNKYKLFQKLIAELISALNLTAEIINPTGEVKLPVHSRDPKDDKILALAISAKADYIITGDKDLLVLNNMQSLGKLRIITVKEFLHIIDRYRSS